LPWFDHGVTSEQLSNLARALAIPLSAPGVCPGCLSFVIFELESGDGRKIAGAVTRVAADLWAEGLDEPVACALSRAVERGVPDAAEAVPEFEERGFRSPLFRAVVRRLAQDLHDAVEREVRASVN
jgi:hypothetical protein